jgi:hypothetical protein
MDNPPFPPAPVQGESISLHGQMHVHFNRVVLQTCAKGLRIPRVKNIWDHMFLAHVRAWNNCDLPQISIDSVINCLTPEQQPVLFRDLPILELRVNELVGIGPEN